MRVLIVDDSKAMRMIVQRAMRQSSVTISELREAGDGAEGLAAVADFDPELILSDWNMPNMNGLEFLTQLRASGNETTFGFVTSESNPAMRKDGLTAGASFLLTKPFTGEHLDEVLGTLVS